VPLLDESASLNMLLKQFSGTNYTPTASYKIAAVVGVPDDEDGTGLVEPTDFIYERITVINDVTNFGLSSDATEVVNLLEWAFPQASEDWGSVFGIALFDASDAYMGYLPFSIPKVVGIQGILKLKAGSFIVTSDSTPLSISIEEALVPTIFTAPNGTRYIASVSNVGALVLTSTTYFGVPSAPTNLLNTAGTLTWDLSPNSGGTPAISQTVWISDSDNQLTSFGVLEASATSYETDYALGSFYVTADNIVGSSAPTNVITIS